MIWHRILFFIFFFSTALPLVYSNLAPCSDYSTTVDTPIEKVKPKDKKQQAIEKKLQKKLWRQEQTKAKQTLKRPALIFWFVFAILAASVVVLSAFLIGLGIIPWIIALCMMLAGDLVAFAILACILFIDVPEFPDVMAFVMGLIGWGALNFIIGIAFLIWGLVIGWVFGWMIGLILLGLAILFLAIYLIAMAIQDQKDKQKGSAEQ